MKLRLCTILLFLCPLLAFAGTVNMQFNDAGFENYYGQQSYPYSVSVNGVASNLMCVGYNEHVVGGETWQATVEIPTQLIDKQAAWLYLQAVADHGADPSINAAAWYLYEGVPSLDASAANWTALAQSQTFTPGEFNGVRIYRPIDGTQSWVGETPQTFLGSTTPEPSSLLLFGSASLGVAGLLRRKLA